jgi:hypothetical protein
VPSLLAHKKYGCYFYLSLSDKQLARERRLKKKIKAAAGKRQLEEREEEQEEE